MMGEGRRFKTVQGIHWANRQVEARIANAAAIVVHRLVSPLATEADDRAPEPAIVSARHHDFGHIAPHDIDDEFLHRPLLR
ncbi:hypothetical protein J4T85_022495 (plasmid) [Sinorhizobium medicae]|uniref:hypothetical protein n=1 Tax=Sinorhizobium medicae TaxID=110321 RepID=UPI0030CBCF26